MAARREFHTRTAKSGGGRDRVAPPPQELELIAASIRHDAAMDALDQLRYPVGKSAMPATVTDAHRQKWIDEIAGTPAALRDAVAGLTDKQLDTPYREGGWTLRQVAHHIPDSHMHAYCRTKYAITENHPTAKPYDENAWAMLADARMPLAPSLAILDGVHTRWVVVLRALKPTDFTRTWFHPENGKTLKVDDLLALYSWHGRHHVAHITSLRQRLRW